MRWLQLTWDCLDSLSNSEHLQMAAASTAQTAVVADADDEIFDLVDECNTVIGKCARGDAHSAGLLHRSAHAILFRTFRQIGSATPTVEVLLQRRSLCKKVGPGLWDISAAEHVSAGEGFLDAAVRGLREELGVSVARDAVASVRGPYLSRQDYPEVGIREHMFTNLFTIMYDEGCGDIVPDEAEVEEVRWWPAHEVVRLAKNKPELFTRWLLIELDNIDLVVLGERTSAC